MANSIDGKTEHKDIANEFAASFKSIYDIANSNHARQLTTELESIFCTLLDNHCTDDVSSN